MEVLPSGSFSVLSEFSGKIFFSVFVYSVVEWEKLMMKNEKKDKTKFFCQECGYESLKWLGRCPDCGKWNTFVEESLPEFQVQASGFISYDQPKPIREIEIKEDFRISTDMEEFDRVLGGGLVTGSVILIGGEPGIGKSTLLLQASSNLSKKNGLVLYVSGEESSSQTKLRAERLGLTSEKLYVLSETNLNVILEHAGKLNPRAVVIDSIQTMFRAGLSSSPGSITQVRECTTQLMYLAKSKGVIVFIVGHVTKEGNFAGPKVLEHIVDTVLYFEGDEHHLYRILRTTKNRFGSTNEIGVFEMRSNGLVQVGNPSQVFLSERPVNSPGSAVVATQEGDRPILVEIQALITGSNFGMPQRRTTGVDYNRISLLMAVLEKRAGLQIGGCDAFVNVAGGIKIDEPAADMGIIIAIASSFKDIPVEEGIVVVGEVGLSGEVRAVDYIERRVREAEKLGFKKCIVPNGNLKELHTFKGIEVVGVKMVGEAIKECLKR